MKTTHLRTAGVLIAATAVVIGMSACSTSTTPSSSSSSSKKISIGSLIYDTTVPYFTPLIAAEKSEAKKLGATIDIENGQGNLTKEIAIVQQFIAEKKTVLDITASDSKGIAPVIKLANQAGIPVIANNTVIIGAKSVTYVGSNNVTYGTYLGKAACTELNGHGKIAVILGILGSSPEFDRLSGMKSYLSSKCPGVTILASQTANWDNTQALTVGQNFLNEYPKGAINAIVDEGPEGIAPAQYAQKNGRTDVKFIVGDIPTAVAGGLQSGILAAAVFQDPAQQGSESVLDAVNWVDGNKSKVKTPTDSSPNYVITKANLSTIKPY